MFVCLNAVSKTTSQIGQNHFDDSQVHEVYKGVTERE